MSAKNDETDWWFKPSNKPKPNKELPNKEKEEDEDDSMSIRPILDPNSEVYASGPGKAIIFNHYEFDRGFSKREGTHVDAKNLKLQLEKLRFDIDEYEDLKYGEIIEVLSSTSKSKTLSNYSCILIAVMTHGEKDKIQARDHGYGPETLWQPFCGNRCAALLGKPKIVLIQACRGEKTDSGTLYTIKTDSKPLFKIPNNADILVMYSTFEDHFSFRSPLNGSWFMQSIVKEFEERANKEDILSILTCVNRTMAFNFESFVVNNKELDGKKQIGTIMSTLTKKFYFYEQREDLKNIDNA